MLAECKFSECAGKTIKAVFYPWCGPAIVTFSDDTFAVIDGEIECGRNIAQVGDAEFNSLLYGTSTLLEMGIFTEEDAAERERKNKEEHRRKIQQRQKEAREKQEFEEWKAAREKSDV